MKKIIIISIVIILTLISFISTCFAFDIGNQELYSKGECPKLLTYKGVPVKTTYIVYNFNGIENPAYCLNVDLPGAEKGSYSVSGTEKLQNSDVWRAIINGFPYKSVSELGAANEQEAFVATKQAVYTMLHGRSTEEYGAVNTEEGRRTYEIYKNIVNAARSSSENIENNLIADIISLDESWKEDSINKNCVSKKYKVNSNIQNGNINIFLQGNLPENIEVVNLNNNAQTEFKIGEEFKILIPIDKLNETDSFDLCAKVSLETKPVVYGRTNIPGTQDYALTGIWKEDIYAKIPQEYQKNITKLRIVKKEYGTDKLLPNVKFNLLDENKNVVFENLITNGNGEVILENLFPGKYFIQEIETLEGYNLYTDLIEINLDLNEEFTATVNNTKKVVENFEKEFEEIEVIPVNKETHYVSNNNTTKIENEVENIKIIQNEKNKEIKRLPKTGY